MGKQKKDKPENKQSIAKKSNRERDEYLKRLKKMALYDARSYLEISSDEEGGKKITLKDDDKIGWDIVETIEINDDKIKVKFPDRSKAMEKYGKVIMGDDEKGDGDIDYIAVFKGEDDDKENRD